MRNKFSAVAALCGLGLLANSGVVEAAAVTCGDANIGDRAFRVDPAKSGGLCYAQNDNLQNVDIAALGLLLVDKDTTEDFPNGDPEAPNAQEGALGFTRTTSTSGTWFFADALWSTYEKLYLAAHFGGAGDTDADNPDSFVVELAARDTSGTYALVGLNGAQIQLNGLSNIYLLGKLCPAGTICNPPVNDVPEPATLGLLGLGLLGLGLRRRKS